ncbi:MAG TPA: flagellar biosynthesis protein FlhA, partial [Candidatus Hydrogenedentes bacterium]|nr:flagellar biosynthesis protein FlhA [Candidatus Hydrogenedentota bacterium]
RVAEVAARFTLDAVPGKQMAIDADLNAGLIDEQQARERRQKIEREASFFGAMDGASKFVRGDAIAALLITAINILGGLAIGVLQRGEDVSMALKVYALLTVGDGLVSQIPALIVSMAAGLIVTRTASQENLGVDMGRQLGAYPRALGIASGLLVLFGIVPGMPAIPFFVVGIILAVMAYQTQAAIARRAAVEAAREVAAEETGAAEGPERTEYLLPVDPLKIELGYGLIALADPKQGGDLLNRIQIIRQQMATRMGFIVPVVRIVDNMRLRPNEYRVKLREAEIARYELLSGHYLAMNPGIVEEEIAGIPTTEPAFGLQALWVSADNRDRAERMGYTIVEPSAVLATHLTELITAHAPELLTRQDVQNLVNVVRESARAVVEELTPNLLSLGEIQKVLQNLLRERVSIRNLETILEVLADFAPRTRDAEVLTEYARQALARQICAEYVDERNALHLVTLAPELEREILDAVRQSETGEYIPLAPARADALARKTVDAVQPLVMSGQDPIVLTSAPVRRYFRRIVERFLPRIVVLSYNEVDPAVRLESEGQVNG